MDYIAMCLGLLVGHLIGEIWLREGWGTALAKGILSGIVFCILYATYKHFVPGGP